MEKELFKFVHYNSIFNTSKIIKLDMNSNNIPHCYPHNNQDLPEYKIEFKTSSSDECLDIYLDKESLFDLYCKYINEVKSGNDEDILVKLENVVYPDERYCYKSHGLICNNKLLQVFYNTPYKLTCNVLLTQENIGGNLTGRVKMIFNFTYRFFFLNFNITRKVIELNLNIDQIIDLQTVIYKEFPEK
jgi:hypothetical protein